MKKLAFAIIAAFFLCSFALGVRIYLGRPYLRQRIVEMVEESLNAKVSAASVTWRWLPAPAITITQLKAESNSLVLAVPTIQLILSPNFFLSGSASLLRAQLIDPDLLITKTGATDPLPQKKLPPGAIHIKNGTLRLPGRALTDTVTLLPISLTGINGTLSHHANREEFTLSANAGFAQALQLHGSVDFPEGAYQMDIAAADFDSARLISGQSTTSPLPMVSGMTFTSHLEGLGANHVTIRLSSKDSPFTVQEHGQTAVVAAIDCTASRHNANLAIDINKLALNDPGMNLSGRVSRQQDDEHGATKPAWHIDMRGTEIDLAAVRDALIARFPSNPITQKVCGIVNGGRATTARYQFDGDTSDFHHLEAMRIWADALDIPVIVPGINLAIDRASGPISIISGQLTGENLSADIDNSHGENGTLLLDLRHDHHAFLLDLDLSADLQNLKEVLTQVVPSPKFQKELSRFTTVDGQAKGHLHLGNDLRQIQTHVDVIAMQAQGRYNRLPWPFTITSGSLTVAPQEVEWRNVQGRIGKHHITKTHGSVNWHDAIELDLDALDADLDLTTLFEQGSLITNGATRPARDFFQGKLEALTGRATLRNTSFSGGIAQPEQWRFHTLVSARDLKLSGPGFPELTSQNVQGAIDQELLRFTGIFSLLNQELFLDGRYGHQLFDRWQGELTIDGDIGPQLGAWLQEKQFIPTALFPNLPFRLEHFTMSSPGTTAALKAHGAIISQATGSTARVQLDINRQPGLISEKLTFIDGARNGTLNYQAWPMEGNRSLLTWQGDLAVKTFGDLFPQHLLADGAFHGAFNRLTDDQSTVYGGEIQLDGVKFKPESLLPGLAIGTLRLAGDSHGMRIEQADISLAESPVQVTGSFSDEKGSRILDLAVTAPYLASRSIQKAIDQMKSHGNANQQSTFRKTLGGTIAIDIGTFDYARAVPHGETTPGEERPHLISITPLRGVLTVRPASFDLEFNNTRACGLSAQGAWHLGNDTADNVVTFSSGQEPLFFEQALPCLGFKQSLIIGPFAAAGEIRGRPRDWKEGTVTLSSPEGLITRMNLLSKIFTAVNFTDYFTWQDLPDINAEGLAYNELTIKAHIENNAVTLDKATIKGKGVNLTGRGTIDLASYDSDLTFFIAPFKMVDSIITGIPLVGKALGGPKESILTFPVKVTGNLKEPEVTSLAPEAIGTAAWEMLIDALTLPYRILRPSEE